MGFDGEILIENILDVSAEGYEDLAGIQDTLYPKMRGKTGPEQQPYQRGFSMNQIMGISADQTTISVNQGTKIEINNLQSAAGRVFGIASWFDTDITFKKHTKLKINDIFAGFNVSKDKYEYGSVTNRRAEACAFYQFRGDEERGNININDEKRFDIQQSCIQGNTGCFGDDAMLSLLGKVDDVKECNMKPVSDNAILFGHEQASTMKHYVYITNFMIITGASLGVFLLKFVFSGIYNHCRKNEKESHSKYGTFK